MMLSATVFAAWSIVLLWNDSHYHYYSTCWYSTRWRERRLLAVGRLSLTCRATSSGRHKRRGIASGRVFDTAQPEVTARGAWRRAFVCQELR
jgi:hypothetical protein